MHENPPFLALRNDGQGHGNRHAFSDKYLGTAYIVVYIVKSVLGGVLYPEVHVNGFPKKKKTCRKGGV